eukprot:jgi/Psemu1/213875/e_gw1.663.17.1
MVAPNNDSYLEHNKASFSEVPLQTCIVPYSGPLGARISPPDSTSSSDPTTTGTTPNPSLAHAAVGNSSSPAISIVLDAYLDNLMANVPQLALCLQEKGLVQSVKLLPTEDIPSKLLRPSTLDTSRPVDFLASKSKSKRSSSSSDPSDLRSNSNNSTTHLPLEEELFSPQIMEMNASALLRFLKTHCTENHSTYLLRREWTSSPDETPIGGSGSGADAGSPQQQQNIHLYDISSISTQKQKKWIWWLATMSYRFALRLRHLESSSASASTLTGLSESQKRAIRDRQRSLFQQTLDLLQDLMDIDGNAHESMVASVREHMADTFLSSSRSSSSSSEETVENITPVSMAATKFNVHNHHHHDRHQQPYASVSIDKLNKAQDHLVRGINTLSSLFEKDLEKRSAYRESERKKQEAAWKRSRRRQRRQQTTANMQQRNAEETEDAQSIPSVSPAMVLQLFGMNFKLVNISLRLAEHHLANYYSSSAMQALRTAARAITSFQYTMTTSDPSEPAVDRMLLLNLLRQRLGDACNETGKVLLAALRTLLVNNQGGKKNDGSQLSAEALLDSAEFWFTQGLDAFEACRDTRNRALIRCNLCQSYKLRANSGFSKGDASSTSKHAEDCLQHAADQLLTAHEDLGQRDVDPQTWDMVSEELAATFLVLGVRRRQSLLGSGNAPVIFQIMRLSPGQERSIVDPMERALKIYEQSNNAHQAAAVHYQLALTYSKLWTCQLNESNTRKKLSKAFDHYSSAFTYFSNHSRGNEPTFCLLCLDLASLYAAIPGEEGLIKSLGCCLDCCDTFSMEAIKSSTALAASTAKSKTDWYDKMETIAHSVDDRVFKLLRSLVKVDSARYKELYREGLTAKIVRNVPEDDEFEMNPKSATLLSLHDVLLAVKKMYGVIIAES